MDNYTQFVIILASFGLILLAAERIGSIFAKFKMPMISGFLLVGILAGPYILGLVSLDMVRQLTFLDDISLAVIAFAAGSELHLQEIRNRLKSIAWVTLANSIIVPIVGTFATYLLADSIPFMQPLTPLGRVAVSILAGAILVARSPSSAIAIINELRARGPFTRTVLGVTMVTDVVIIIVFAIAMSTAHVLFNGGGLQADFLLILATDLIVSFAVGYLLGRVLHLVLSLRIPSHVKIVLILALGYAVFVGTDLFRAYSHNNLPFEIALEVLLICMIGSFVVTNYSPYRTEFLSLMHRVGPPIYVIFFTLTGAALRLDVFVQVWTGALALFAIRLVAVFAGSFIGGAIAGDARQHNLLSWMTYITQAGVALGLAREVVTEFPEWGAAFATMMISTVVVSQLVGPPLFKFAIQRAGEAHTQAPGQAFDGERDAIIFGLEGQSVSLARLLNANGWNTVIATRQADLVAQIEETDVKFHIIKDLSKASLDTLPLRRADAIVTMLTNDENYQVCELVYEHYGIRRLIVRLAQSETSNRFAQLDAILIEPTTAVVTLLDHFVRAPQATSIFLGREPDQRVVDIEVTNPNIDGLILRDLRLPLDVLIVSVTRDDTTLVSHGYTQLALGDCVSAIGSHAGLEQVALQLEA